jgi:hypothetical protein
MSADPLEFPVSMEERLRGGDRKIEACLLVETLRVPDAEKIAGALASEFSRDRNWSLSAALRNHCRRPRLGAGRAHVMNERKVLLGLIGANIMGSLSPVHEEPAFSELFLAHLLARTMRVEEDLVDQLFNSSEKRLARALLLLANFGKEGKPEPILAKISQETLAEMIGTTRSRVSHFMNKFRQLGLIDYNGAGTLEVHSSLLNVVLHDQPQIKR